ncbi:MAG: hypothetical protein Q7S21_03820 [archaeon]|nr:hypothetical protein [archaeon]
MLEGLKDFYYSLEEKWYGVLDKIEEKGVHIYGIIDKIDQVIPSFILFLLIVLLIILFGALFLFGGVLPQTGGDIAFKVEVKNSDGELQNNASVTIQYSDTVLTLETNDFGETEPVTIPFGTLIDISVEKEGYKPAEILQFEVTSNEAKTITLERFSEEEGKQWTFKLVGADGQPLYGERFELSFACNNPEAVPPNDKTINSPIITVIEPPNCDGLSVSINSSKFLPINSVSISSDSQEIRLTEKTTADETILQVVVSDAETLDALDGIRVEVAATAASTAVDFGDTINGEKTFFDLLPQAYVVRVFDRSSNYKPASKNITLSLNDTTQVEFFLEKSTDTNDSDTNTPTGIDDTLAVQIVEAGNRRQIDNALVTLKKGNEVIATERSDIDKNSVVNFVVPDVNASYIVTIDHEDYFLKVQPNLKAGKGIVIIELNPFIASEGGSLSIQVFDLDRKPVKGATVELADTEEFILGYEPKVTDFNGTAIFERIKSGNYKAFAFKGYGKGWTDSFNFQIKRIPPPIYNLILRVDNGIIRISVTDKELTPLRFAQLTFFDSLGDTVIGTKTLEDANGVFDFVSRADKTIYVKATKEGYTTTTTEEIEIKPSIAQELPIVLERETISGDVKIRFLGLFSKEGEKAQTLTADTQYVARFEMVIPKEAEYSEAGINVRIGDKELVDNDVVFIKEINAPNAAITKYSRYSENYNNDKLSLTNFESKWSNIVWTNPITGVYEVEAIIKTKDNAVLGDNIPVHYRAWAKNTRGQTLRDPKDNAVKLGEEWYAEPFTENFAIGAGTICSTEFCFDVQILDKTENIIKGVSEEYEARLFREYELSFTLINNAVSFVHQNAELRIKNANKGLVFTGYSITTAQGNTLTNTIALNTNDLSKPPIIVGTLAPGNRVKGTLKFKTIKSANNIIEFLLVSDQRIRFEKDIAVRVDETKELKAEVLPVVIPALTQNTLSITIKDKETDLEVGNVLVKIKDRFGSVLASGTTSPSDDAVPGFVSLDIPALDPLTELSMTAELEGYKPLQRTLTISEKFIEVTPESLGFSLNPQTKKEDLETIEVNNQLYFDVTIDSFTIEGDLKNLIDKEKMNNFLAEQNDSRINSGKKREFEVKAFVSKQAENLISPKNVAGTLVLKVSNTSGGAWTIEIPTRFTIGLGGEVDLSSCFNISKASWTDNTEGNPVKLDIDLQNNCTVKGSPVDLKNVEAMVQWQGNEVGEFSLSIPEEAFVQLRNSYFRRFIGILPKDSSKTTELEFTPNGGVNTEAKAKILIRAVNVTEKGEEELEDSIDVSIRTLNLLDCISFSSSLVEMPRDGSAKLSVETLDCGENVRFSFDSDLDIVPKTITLSSKQKSPEIIISPQGKIPGQYLINVQIDSQSSKVKTKVKNLIARVHPLASDCLSLDRYEFDIFDDPETQFDGFDQGTLTNNCVEKQVKTKIDVKSLGNAMKSALPWSLAALAGAAILNPTKFVAPFKTIGDWLNPNDKDIDGASEVAREEGGVSGKGGASEASKKDGGTAGTPSTAKTETPQAEETTEDKESPRSNIQNLQNDDTVNGKTPIIVEASDNIELGAVELYIDDKLVATECNSQQTCNFTYMWNTLSLRIQYSTIQTKAYDKAGNVESNPAVLKVFVKNSAFPSAQNGIVSATGFVDLSEIANVNVRAATVPNLNLGSLLQGGIFGFAQTLIKTIVGPVNPWVAGIGTFVIGTVVNYLNQDDIQLIVLQPDLVMKNIGLFIEQTPLQEIPDTRIELTLKEKEEEILLGKKIEHTPLVFRNAVNLIQSDPLTPFFSTLKNEGDRQNYKDKKYKDSVPKNSQGEISLETGTPTKLTQKFHLQFNAIDPSERVDDGVATLSCAIGSKQGSTGEQALPQVEFDWSWNNNSGARCDADDGKTFCDAAQLSIELTERLKNIDEWFTTNASALTCPNGVQCPGISSANLGAYFVFPNVNIPQTEQEKINSLLEFDALLIQDGYSNDFITDFDDYARNKSFANTPEYYINNAAGIGLYFKDASKLKFDYAKTSSNAPIAGPGKYHVQILIDYITDPDWKLFKGNAQGSGAGEKRNAIITIKFSKLSSPEEAVGSSSAFYYLPIDGLIGADNSRIGYGADFSGTEIKVNNSSTAESVSTTSIPGSVPVINATGISFNDFKSLNTVQSLQGNTLKIDKTGDEISLTYSPSYANPLQLEIDHSVAREDAFAFYSVEVDGSAQNTGAYLARWNGVGANCKDFNDRELAAAFDNTTDLHGLNNNLECARLGGDQLSAYGLEWCSPVNTGKVLLETVIYTPVNSNAIIKKFVSSDDAGMRFKTIDGGTVKTATQFSLNKGESVNSIERVFDLVKENKMCVTTNDSSTTFWWNPKPLLDGSNGELLAEKQNFVDNQCIQVK